MRFQNEAKFKFITSLQNMMIYEALTWTPGRVIFNMDTLSPKFSKQSRTPHERDTLNKIMFKYFKLLIFDTLMKEHFFSLLLFKIRSFRN